MEKKYTIDNGLKISGGNLPYALFTEKEAKKCLSENGLDYTYLNYVFLQVIDEENPNILYYMKQFNFDFCIKEIKALKECKSHFVFHRQGW